MAKVKAQDDKLPGTVFSARQVRFLKIAVIAMGILLVGGFAFVLAAIVYQASHLKQTRSAEAPAPSATAPEAIDLPIGQGASVAAMSLDGNRLAIHLNGAEGPEIVVIELANGKVVSRVKLKPQ